MRHTAQWVYAGPQWSGEECPVVPESPIPAVRYVVRRVSDGKFMSWDGWGTTMWVSSGGNFSSLESAIRHAEIEETDADIFSQAGIPGYQSDAPLELAFCYRKLAVPEQP